MYPRIHHQQSHKRPAIANACSGRPTALRLKIIGTGIAAITRAESRKIQRTRSSRYLGGVKNATKRDLLRSPN
ncbi:MAG: hypothetical protein H0T57_01445 [Rubrobacter sp.]|nr:hypothetical protein [Rubrobacter sp.]